MRRQISKKASERAKPRQSALADGLLDSEPDGDDNQIVLALARGLDILDSFRRADIGLGNAELADRTGLPKPTVSRITYTLARHGYLRFDPHAKEYCLGIKAVSLGAVAQAMSSVRRLAVPLMRELAERSHFNVGLGMRHGHQMIYTDACEGNGLITLRLVAGSRVPVATSAMGRAYLGSLDPDERAALMSELRPRYDDDWPRVQRGVDQALRDLAAHGYCLSLGEWHRDIHGVAAAIRALPGQPTYVVNLGGPAYALSEAELRGELGPKIVELAGTLGFSDL